MLIMRLFCLKSLLTVVLLFSLVATVWAGGAVERTLEVLGNVSGVTTEQLESSKEIIEKLDYTNMRVFRALCGLPDMTASKALKLLPVLTGEPINYEHLLLFEQFCTLPGVELPLALRALQEIIGLDYVSVWAGVSLCRNSSLHPAQALSAILMLREINDPARWAAKAFFEINGHTDDSVIQGLTIIKSLSPEQCWAVEANSKIAAITVQDALINMAAISMIGPGNILTVKALLALPEMTGAEAHVWLTGYFVKPETEHDADYQMLPPRKKTILLKAYLNAADHVVLVLNNLHSVTNQEGDEIPDAQLASFSFQRLGTFFSRFPPETRSRFDARFARLAKKGDKGGAISCLREATAFARKESAKRLSTANIYAVMTKVSILYDSSFRLILITELQKRIAAVYQGSLLHFMQGVDPDNVNVANFVSSLSLKARLAIFLPPDVQGQEDIIDLVTASAFKDGNSLVLFAATFEKLLDGLLPATRIFLVDRMIYHARDASIFAQQIRTILQYYLEGKPKLLGAENGARVRELLVKYDAPPLASYIRTPFTEWLQDRTLSALSVFHGDDDGRSSFIAFGNLLLNKGYLPRPSTRFRANQSNSFVREELAGFLIPVTRKQNGSLERLFRFLKETPLVVDFVKTVNTVLISHSVCVFYNGDTQQKLLEQFILDGHEMYAPRGHSYWLNDHILDPLQNLIKSERVNSEELTAKQRFLSIGACGGIKIYADLTQAFCNKVDMLGSLGAGKTTINNLYNWFLFETIATESQIFTWKDMDRKTVFIFREDTDKDYQQPGELPAILYKIVGKRKCRLRPFEADL
ncbi:MAG: hypothetical protein KKC76_19755 [Proteobacteria bacterium]|nr:hypothetical protein [Pseudomonadota bacterium]MBU4297569.1 hypothetical protein [Pseudomonadota bacterium]MCG2749091.1 hypothetical protein [Desulfobulbaceae bacterium]